jgi:hypothetical protein
MRATKLAGGYLRRNSRQKGLFGNDGFWRAVFLLICGRKVWHKLMGKEPEVLSTEQLKPGQELHLLAIDPKTLRGDRNS